MPFKLHDYDCGYELRLDDVAWKIEIVDNNPAQCPSSWSWMRQSQPHILISSGAEC